MKKLILMLVVLMMLGQTAHAAITIQDTLAKAVPEDAILFSTIEDAQGIWGAISASNAWAKVKELKIWQEMQLGDNLNQFKTQFKQSMGFDLSQENIMALLGSELALAVTGDPDTMQYNVVIIAKPGDPLKAKELVKTFTETVNASGGEFKFVESKYNLASLWSLQPKEADSPMPIQAGYGFARDNFIFSIGMGPVDLKKTVDLLGGKGKSIVENAKFMKIMGHATSGQGKFNNAFYIDVARLKEVIKTIPIPDQDAQMFAKSMENALGQTDVMAGTVSISKGIRAKFASIPTDSPMNKIAANLQNDPGLQASGHHLRYVPKNSIAYFGGKVPGDMVTYWNLLKEQMTEMGSWQMVQEIIGQIEATLEINFEQDVLSWIGDEVSFVFAGIDTTKPFPFPKIALITEVKETAKPRALINKLVETANTVMTENMPEDSGFKLELKSETVGGNKINTVELPMPQMGLIFQPGYSFIDKSLAIALDTDLIKEMLQARTTNANILGSKYFVSAGIPVKATSIGYINMEQGLLAAKDVALQVVSLAEMSGAGEDAHNAVNNYAIPILDALGAIKSIVSYGIYAGDHIEGIVDIRIQDIE
jgi:Protein of unknown function (DUF3352)